MRICRGYLRGKLQFADVCYLPVVLRECFLCIFTFWVLSTFCLCLDFCWQQLRCSVRISWGTVQLPNLRWPGVMGWPWYSPIGTALLGSSCRHQHWRTQTHWCEYARTALSKSKPMVSTLSLSSLINQILKCYFVSSLLANLLQFPFG